MKNLKKALGALLIYHLLFLQGTGKKTTIFLPKSQGHSLIPCLPAKTEYQETKHLGGSRIKNIWDSTTICCNKMARSSHLGFVYALY